MLKTWQNSMVFTTFAVLKKLCFRCHFRGSEFHFGGFLESLGFTSSHFDGLGRQLDGWMDAGWPSGRPEGPQDPEPIPRWGLSICSWGPTVSKTGGLHATDHMLQDTNGKTETKLQATRKQNCQD